MITSYDRLQPMDEQGDYPIKVLIMAPLITVSLPTVSSFLSTRGCFLRGGWSPSRDPPPLSLSSGWPPGANGSPPVDGGASRVLGLKILRVQGEGGRTGHRSGLGRPAWADQPGPTSARFGRPFAPVGRHVMILTMSSSRPRWRFSSHEVRSFTLQSPGVFLVALSHPEIPNFRMWIERIIE
jgi:hypothetical protein